MKLQKAYTIGNCLLECITDEEALIRYGSKEKRILITKRGKTEHHELISPTIIIQ